MQGVVEDIRPALPCASRMDGDELAPPQRRRRLRATVAPRPSRARAPGAGTTRLSRRTLSKRMLPVEEVAPPIVIRSSVTPPKSCVGASNSKVCTGQSGPAENEPTSIKVPATHVSTRLSAKPLSVRRHAKESVNRSAAPVVAVRWIARPFCACPTIESAEPAGSPPKAFVVVPANALSAPETPVRSTSPLPWSAATVRSVSGFHALKFHAAMSYADADDPPRSAMAKPTTAARSGRGRAEATGEASETSERRVDGMTKLPEAPRDGRNVCGESPASRRSRRNAERVRSAAASVAVGGACSASLMWLRRPRLSTSGLPRVDVEHPARAHRMKRAGVAMRSPRDRSLRRPSRIDPVQMSRLRPVISAGCGRSIISSSVGATSARRPSSRSSAPRNRSPTTTSGTV